MLHDFVLALRTLRARRSGTWLSIGILALGLGFATAIVAVADAVLFKPLPYDKPDELVFVWDRTREQPLTNLTPGRLMDLRERLQTVSGVAGISHLSFTLTGHDAAERLPGASVSSNFFDVLGAAPARGRVFHSGERDRQLVVLSDMLWRRRFGSDPSIVGTAVTLDGRPHTIAGVMPPDFYWTSITVTPSRGPHPELWVITADHEVPGRPGPADVSPRTDRRTGYLRAVARLKPSLTIQEAEAEAAALSRRLESEYPTTDAGRASTLVPARRQLLSQARLPVWLLLGAAALVLAGAGINVANLRLMRLAGRRRDLSVQVALGASRTRIVRQIAVETAVVVAVGASIGAALAALTMPLMKAAVPVEVPRLAQAVVGVRAMLATAAAAAVCAATMTVLQVAAVRRLPGVAGSERSQTTRVAARTRRVLVAAEVTVALVLMTGALLFGRSLNELRRVDVGIHDVDRLLTFNIVLSGERRGATHAQRVAFFDEVLSRIRHLPSVEHAAVAATLPIGGDEFGAQVFAEGTTDDTPRSAGYQVVGSGWFDTLGIPLLSGRDFTAADDQARRVVIVNKSFAEREWPGRDPIGRRVRFDGDAPWMTVVGLVADIRHGGPRHPPRPEVYEPQSQRSFSFTAVAVRTAGDPSSLIEAIRAEVARLDPQQPISGVATMKEHLLRTHAETRSLLSLTSAFGVVALVVAALGVYGALAFSVRQRTREFGVRLALGARPLELAASVLRDAMMTAGAGLVAGIAMSFFAARALQSLLFGVPPGDATAYGAAAAALLVVTAVAAYVPARAAMRADPSSLLRAE